MHSGILLVFGEIVRMLNTSLLCKARFHKLFSMPHLILVVLKVTRPLPLGWWQAMACPIAIHNARY
jgi:hypothetical protein